MIHFAMTVMLAYAEPTIAVAVERQMSAPQRCLHLVWATCTFAERCPADPNQGFDWGQCIRAVTDDGRKACARLEKWPPERIDCAQKLIAGPGCEWPAKECGP